MADRAEHDFANRMRARRGDPTSPTWWNMLPEHLAEDVCADLHSRYFAPGVVVPEVAQEKIRSLVVNRTALVLHAFHRAGASQPAVHLAKGGHIVLSWTRWRVVLREWSAGRWDLWKAYGNPVRPVETWSMHRPDAHRIHIMVPWVVKHLKGKLPKKKKWKRERRHGG